MRLAKKLVRMKRMANEIDRGRINVISPQPAALCTIVHVLFADAIFALRGRAIISHSRY